LDGELDKIIPFWFWNEKEVVPSKYAEELRKGEKKWIDMRSYKYAGYKYQKNSGTNGRRR
jgi:hypothetical protein